MVLDDVFCECDDCDCCDIAPVAETDFLLMKQSVPATQTETPWNDYAWKISNFTVERAYPNQYTIKPPTGIENDPSPDIRAYYFKRTSSGSMTVDALLLKAMEVAKKFVLKIDSSKKPIIGNLRPGTVVKIKEHGSTEAEYIVMNPGIPLEGKTLLLRKYAIKPMTIDDVNPYIDDTLVSLYTAPVIERLSVSNIQYYDALNGYPNEKKYRTFMNLGLEEVFGMNPLKSKDVYKGTDSQLLYSNYLRDIFPNNKSRICYTDATETTPVEWMLRDESKSVLSYNLPTNRPSYFVVTATGEASDTYLTTHPVYVRPALIFDSDWDFYNDATEDIIIDLPDYLNIEHVTDWKSEKILKLIAANQDYYKRYYKLLFSTENGLYKDQNYYKFSLDDSAYMNYTITDDTFMYPFDYVIAKLKQFIDIHPDNFQEYLKRQYNAPFAEWKLRIYKDLDISPYKRYYGGNILVYTDYINLAKNDKISEFVMPAGVKCNLGDIKVYREFDVYQTGDVGDGNGGTIKMYGRRLVQHPDDGGDLFALDTNGNRIWRVDIMRQDGTWSEDVNNVASFEISYGIRVIYLLDTIYPEDTSIAQCTVHWEFTSILDTLDAELQKENVTPRKFDQPRFVVDFNNANAEGCHETVYVPYVAGFQKENCEIEHIGDNDHVYYLYSDIYNLKGSALNSEYEKIDYYVIDDFKILNKGKNYYKGMEIYIDVRDEYTIKGIVDEVDDDGGILKAHVDYKYGEFENLDVSVESAPAIPDTIQRIDDKVRYGKGNSSGTLEDVVKWFDNNTNKEYWDVATFDISAKISRTEIREPAIYNVETNNTYTIRKIWPYRYTKEFKLPSEQEVYIHPDINYNNELHLEDVRIWNTDTQKYEDFNSGAGDTTYTVAGIIPSISKSVEKTNEFTIKGLTLNGNMLNLTNTEDNVYEIVPNSIGLFGRLVRDFHLVGLDIDFNSAKRVETSLAIISIEPTSELVDAERFAVRWKLPQPLSQYRDAKDLSFKDREAYDMDGKLIFTCDMDVRFTLESLTEPGDATTYVEDAYKARILNIYNIKPAEGIKSIPLSSILVGPDFKYNNDIAELPDNIYGEGKPYDHIDYVDPPVMFDLVSKIEDSYTGLSINYSDYYLERKFKPGLNSELVHLRTDSGEVLNVPVEVSIGDRPHCKLCDNHMCDMCGCVRGWKQYTVPLSYRPQPPNNDEYYQYTYRKAEEYFTNSYKYPTFENTYDTDNTIDGTIEAVYVYQDQFLPVWYKIDDSAAYITGTSDPSSLIFCDDDWCTPYFDVGWWYSPEIARKEFVYKFKVYSKLTYPHHWDSIDVEYHLWMSDKRPNDSPLWKSYTDKDLGLTCWYYYKFTGDFDESIPWQSFSDRRFGFVNVNNNTNWTEYVDKPFLLAGSIMGHKSDRNGVSVNESVIKECDIWVYITEPQNRPTIQTENSPNVSTYELAFQMKAYDIWISYDKTIFPLVAYKNCYYQTKYNKHTFSYAQTKEIVQLDKEVTNTAYAPYFKIGMNTIKMPITNIFYKKLADILVYVWIGTSEPPVDVNYPDKIWTKLTETMKIYGCSCCPNCNMCEMCGMYEEYNCWVWYDESTLPINQTTPIVNTSTVVTDTYTVIANLVIDTITDGQYPITVYVWPKLSVKELAFGFKYTDVSYQMRITCDETFQPANLELRIWLDIEEQHMTDTTEYGYSATTIDRKTPIDRLYVKMKKDLHSANMPLLDAAMTNYYLTYVKDDDGANATVSYDRMVDDDVDLYLKTLPYPMSAVYSKRAVTKDGYLNLLNSYRLRSQFSSTRYDLYSNGRLLTERDQYHLVSPTKIFCHGLTSLRNIEVIETNREPVLEYFAPDTMKNAMDDILEARFMDGTSINEFSVDEQEAFIRREVWRQVNPDNPLFIYYPYNFDIDEDVFSIALDSLANTDSTSYKDLVTNPPKIEEAIVDTDIRWGEWDTNRAHAVNWLSISNEEISELYKEAFRDILDDEHYTGIFDWNNILGEDRVTTEEGWVNRDNNMKTEYTTKSSASLGTNVINHESNGTLMSSKSDEEWSTIVTVIESYRWLWKRWGRVRPGLYKWDQNGSPEQPYANEGKDTNWIHNETDPTKTWGYPYSESLPYGNYYYWENPGYWDDGIYKPGKPIVWELPEKANVTVVDDTDRRHTIVNWNKCDNVISTATSGQLNGLVVPYTVKILTYTPKELTIKQEFKINDANQISLDIGYLDTKNKNYIYIVTANRAGKTVGDKYAYKC
jgi:hypothetical protein